MCSVRLCSASSSARNSFSTLLYMAPNFASASFPVGCQARELTAPIAGIAPALRETLSLELVEEADEMAPVVAERVGDLALCLRACLRGAVRARRNAVVSQSGWFQCVLRAVPDHEPEPLEQESAAEKQFLGGTRGWRRQRCR